jgi:hypothetical protein
VSIPKLQDVCATVVLAVEAALAAANAPGVGQVYIGWPTGPEESQKLGQPQPEGSVTVYPTKSASNITQYPAEPTILTAAVNNLVATISKNLLTFSGVGDKPYNVHGFFGGRTVDAYYATTAAQTLASIATAYAAAINALGVGLGASAAGATVTLSGGQFSAVNIGSSGTYAIEELRIKRTIAISVWINDAPTRWAVADAILSRLGTAENHFLTLSDGSQAYFSYLADYMDDSSESSYSLLVHHLWYDCEYGIIQTGSATQIEGIEVVQTIDQLATTTTYSG